MEPPCSSLRAMDGPIMRRKKPEIIEVKHERLKDVADRAKTSLDPEDA